MKKFLVVAAKVILTIVLMALYFVIMFGFVVNPNITLLGFTLPFTSWICRLLATLMLIVVVTGVITEFRELRNNEFAKIRYILGFITFILLLIGGKL